ncbi:MAG: pseudouridine synthase [Tenericutes bacterium]|nr:pseudouridine synthase [Mycoplasmatota bacterium]
MRINNYISSSGYCSRRKADEYIKNGKVKINGLKADIGQNVNDDDIVEVLGKIIVFKNIPVYISFNKPIGITCTTDRKINGNIIDFIGYKERIFPIGRLDKDSEGLILLTNDGNIVNEILRSSNNHEKDYVVTVDKNIDTNFINDMSNGIKIFNPVRNEYTITKKCKVAKINNNVFKITLTQGLNRQIRRMCNSLGYNVINLKRIRLMNIELKNLPTGSWRHINKIEIKNMMDLLKIIK